MIKRKYLIKTLSIIFTLSFFVLLFLPEPGFFANAQGEAEGEAASENEEVDLNQHMPDLEVAIGGTTLILKPAGACDDSGDSQCIGWIGDYVSALYKYGVGVAAVLAAVMIMVGGFIWLMSAGSPDKVGKAKDFIFSALSGLFLALFSFIILATINPELVKFSPLSTGTLPEFELGSLEGVDVAGVSSGGPSGGTSGVAASNVPVGTNLNLVSIPGFDTYHMSETRPELQNTMNDMITQLAAQGKLPAGLQINSALRTGDSGQHGLGTAVDFSFTGIDYDSAHAFEAAVLEFNPDLQVYTEVRGDPDRQYFRGSGPGVVHIDMRNILGTR